MAYRIFKSFKTGQYEVEECRPGMGTFDNLAQVETNIKRLMDQDAEWAKIPDDDKWLAIHGIPSLKSLENLDARLAEIKRAEDIANGTEEL